MRTPEEVFRELNNKRLIKWEGLSDGGKWTRAIEAMKEYASQFYSEEQLLEAIDLARDLKDYHGYRYSIRQILDELKSSEQPKEPTTSLPRTTR